mmetsp:Transcript_39976/g.55567  ORF Transcript_39976/g.55567 Transcript_39976/m.55567 type:complete len:194 (+) Transcript_39976:206-787(+)|eukprot:CAMPEP_0196588688 /NCGR_PEP_ID=MMETSP1081-20130531/61368_1 /TAXON_ID=36882 /ORGANISM="Pyramimonas amylifera, Strain CCMP720" /LENGTH=193 /DNA_ID=CAMNT_0041911261 /DNA_START=115 /DNA_END=696 /DNA_ORIENTATION=+
MVFYMNLTILNKEEVIKAQFQYPSDNVSAWSLVGVLGGMAGSVANTMVTTNTIAGKLAKGIASKIPDKLLQMGITAKVEVKYLQGSFVVLRVTIETVDAKFALLVAGKETESRRVEKIEKVAHFFGSGEKFHEKSIMKAESKIREVISTKLPTGLENETGMKVDLVIKTEQEEAEYLFAVIQHLGLTGAPARS